MYSPSGDQRGSTASPDGISVAYQNGRDVHVLNLRTRQTRRVTYEPLNGMHPTWSPMASGSRS